MSELEARSEESSAESAGEEPLVAKPSREEKLPVEGRRSQQRSSKGVATHFVSGFWRRALAGCVDLLVILPVSLLLCKVAGSLAGLSLPPSRVQGLDFWLDLLLAGDGTLIGALGLTLAIASLYSLIFHISMGRTIGMRALKLRIIDVYGDEPSTNRALVRTAGYLLGVATLGLGFIWIAFDSEKRGLHDWLAGTYVVKT
jgi:uncharacterized RDD family membrane protein YckC